MSALIEALRRKFNTPKDVLIALGLDAALAEDAAITGDNKEGSMAKTKLSPRGLVAKGALMTYLAPRLAQDAKVDLTKMLLGVTAKNFTERSPAIVTALTAATKGKLAQDADLEDVAEMLEAVARIQENDDDEMLGRVESDDVDPDADIGGDGVDLPPHAQEFLKSKMSDEDYVQFCAMLGAEEADVDKSGEDETPEQKMEREKLAAMHAKDKAARDEEQKKEDMKAMDAKIAAAVAGERANQRAIQAAIETVRPFVGALPKAAMACDSADDVYKEALTMLGVADVAKIHPSAYPALLAAQQPRGAKSGSRLAHDALPAGGIKSPTDFFPGSASIRVMG